MSTENPDLSLLAEVGRLERIAAGVPRLNLSDTDALEAGFDRNKVGMGVVLNDRVVYAGTVPAHVKTARRKTGKAQRKARKAHR